MNKPSMSVDKIVDIIDNAISQIEHLDKHAIYIKLEKDKLALSTELTLDLLKELKAVFNYEQHTEQPIKNAGLGTSTPQGVPSSVAHIYKLSNIDRAKNLA